MAGHIAQAAVKKMTDSEGQGSDLSVTNSYTEILSTYRLKASKQTDANMSGTAATHPRQWAEWHKQDGKHHLVKSSN